MRQDPSQPLKPELSPGDHRLLGRRLGLFTFDDAVGAGLPLWQPAGECVRQSLMSLIAELLRTRGYQPVSTPHIGKLGLYRRSGHFPYYAESQFPPMLSPAALRALDDDGVACGQLANLLAQGELDGYLLKPMNCPHHIHIFKSAPRSYRDLPVRYCEFGTVYRWEQSGELSGMTRVRALTVDDAHIFCRPDQVPSELAQCLSLVRAVFETLGLADYRVRVGLRDPDSAKFVGDQARWDQAEAMLLRAARDFEPGCQIEAGQAAFYGPKIDFVVGDVQGRPWQLGTVQLDHNLPERFELAYVDEHGQRVPPVMIHRAPLGSLERFVALLTEHFAGAFPLWLAPLQLRILPVRGEHVGYAEAVLGELASVGLRVDLDARADRLPARVRAAVELKIPYILVVGRSEMETQGVSVRVRGSDEVRTRPLPELRADLLARVASRSLGLG